MYERIAMLCRGHLMIYVSIITVSNLFAIEMTHNVIDDVSCYEDNEY